MEIATSKNSFISSRIGPSNNVLNTSLGAQLVKAVHARQLQQGPNRCSPSDLRRNVELLLEIGEVIGLGITDPTIQSGMALHGVKLFPSEVAVYITQVHDISHWTGEVVGEKLGLCMGLTIHWNRSHIRYVAANDTIPNAEGEV